MQTDSTYLAEPIAEPMPPWPLPTDGTAINTPESRGIVLLESSDHKLGCGQWRCAPGRFRFTYTVDEFFYILAGLVEIQVDNGPKITLKGGDTAHFPPGAATVWNIIEPVHKVFFFRNS